MSKPSFCTLTVTLAAKLAAVVVHTDEMLSADGHPFDKAALKTVLEDEEVAKWLRDVGPLAPVKRRKP